MPHFPLLECVIQSQLSCSLGHGIHRSISLPWPSTPIANPSERKKHGPPILAEQRKGRGFFYTHTYGCMLGRCVGYQHLLLLLASGRLVPIPTYRDFCTPVFRLSISTCTNPWSFGTNCFFLFLYLAVFLHSAPKYSMPCSMGDVCPQVY